MKHIKLFEEFEGGVNYDNALASQLKASCGNLNKLTPYVLDLGGEPPLNVEEVSGGKVQVKDKMGNIVKIFNDIDAFVNACSCPMKM